MSHGVLSRLWLGMNLTDRIFVGWFLGLGMLIALLPGRVEHPIGLVLLHSLVLAGIALVTRYHSRNASWRFAHDWYPLVLLTVGFEETARLSFLMRDGWQDHWIISLEGQLFSVPPTVWFGEHSSRWITEILEVGYFSYYGFFITVAGILYARAYCRSESARHSVEAGNAFRALTDSVVLGYIICFAIYLLFPTEGPRYIFARLHAAAPLSGGPFHWAVELIQKYGGVHGNAFPSAHIMAATVVVLFAARYCKDLFPWVLPLFVLMCFGAINNRYHYASDIVAGIVLGFAVALPFLKDRRSASRAAMRSHCPTRRGAGVN